MEQQCVDSRMMQYLLHGGMDRLSKNAEEVNDLNVFPIPDGDTGSNMLLTIRGGEQVLPEEGEGVGSYSRRIADGMLLSARGNSGVILSQFADGIAAGLEELEIAGPDDFASALKEGVRHAYDAVMEPTEGTILTVVREASDYAASSRHESLEDYVSAFLIQAHKTLDKTPDMLPVLKEAGVVDSGGAGLIYIVEGISDAISGKEPEQGEYHPEPPVSAKELELDKFNENSVLEFGYCTELLLRLQTCKTDPETFDVNIIRDFLQSVGNSVVCFKTGSIVKLHVHTKTPYQVLEFCQRYGEYLTVKIENMTLQHNNLSPEKKKQTKLSKRKDYAVVTVAAGEGIKQAFREMGADAVVEGGQSMNPSADDFMEAFDEVNADTVFVLPNNGNVILTAKQAGKLYKKADVRVIESHSIGDGYAALQIMNTDSHDTDAIVKEMTEAMDGVQTASVSLCSRDTERNGFLLKKGQYIGFTGSDILSADNDRCDTACMLVDRLDFTDREICILISGEDSEPEETERIADYIRKSHRGCEVYTLNGGQAVYSYIMIIE